MYLFCVIISIILFCSDIDGVSFSSKQQSPSSNDLKTEDIDRKMIIEFAKDHDIKYLTYYFDANEFQSRKTLHQILIKAKKESLFFSTKEISMENSNQEKMNNDIKQVLHVYICNTLNSLRKVVDSKRRSNFQSKDGINDLNHYWLIKIPEDKDAKHFQSLLNGFQSDNDAKIFLYSGREDHKISIYILQPNGNFPETLKLFSTWTQNVGFSSRNVVIKASQKSLKNEHIRMVSAFSPPAVTYIEDNCSSKRCFKGLFADVWHALVEQMNFTYTIRRAHQWGSYENGKWNGMVGMLHRGKADIAATDLTVTVERSKAVDFLPTLLETTEGLYMKNPGDAFSLVSYFGPFSETSWICLLLWVTVTPFFLVIIEWVTANRDKTRKSIIDCSVNVASSLLNTKNWTIQNQYSGRIAFACIVIGGMIFFYHWEAELIAYMSAKKIDLPFRSLEEFSEKPEFKLIVGKGTVHVDTFRYSKDPIHSKIWKEKMMPYFDDLPLYEKLVETVINDPYSVTFTDSSVEMTKEFLNCEMVKVGLPIRTSHLAFAVQKKSPLYIKFRDQIKRLKESGLVRRYIQRYNMESQKCESYSGKSVSIHQCVTMFQILLSGVIISFFWLLAEFVISLIQNHTSFFRKKLYINRRIEVKRHHTTKNRQKSKTKKLDKRISSVLVNHRIKEIKRRHIHEDQFRKEVADRKVVVKEQQK